MNIYFYDIESLPNVFSLANFRKNDNEIDIYYLLDDELIEDDIETYKKKQTERIHERNKNFNGKVFYYDLHEGDSNIKLAKTFGLSDAYYINSPKAKSTYPDAFRITCDTDTDYDDEKDPYFIGYNSYNYDTTMLTMYFFDTFKAVPKGVPVSFLTKKMDKKPYVKEYNDAVVMIDPPAANTIRKYNNELFEHFINNMPDRLRYEYLPEKLQRDGHLFDAPNYKNPKAIIRKNMLMSGRHIDAARLNEKQQKVALKRLLAMLGLQILESDKLDHDQPIRNMEELLELIAYNVSDVINLDKLFDHKIYQSGFALKKQLLKTYPELVYKEKGDTYKPDISPYSVRNDRLTIDSSSAQLATKSLCPYGHLSDYDTVSFMYPSEKKAEEYGIPRVNVLEESKKFFYANFGQYPEDCKRFDEIYDYYKSIEGKNFNSSQNYLLDHGADDNAYNPEDCLADDLKPRNLKDIKAPNTCMFYYNADGTPSSCFINFSTGGIHGAEYNKLLYESDLAKYNEAMKEYNDKLELFEKVKKLYPDPRVIKAEKSATIDGVKYAPSTFLAPKSTAENAKYKEPPKPPKKPELFVISPSSGTWNIAKRYTFTSADKTQHEDFTSYYPNMLRMMEAFFNEGLGYDRYGEIFDNKTKYGKMMKDEAYSKEERDLYSVMREGTKLILNSASGAADANFESNIRMNNKIISMRIIGQLFTWRIGQAQTLKGAAMISTNTDGLYSSKLEEDVNNKVLEEEAHNIHVDIEPEPIFLISKDSNNRTEIECDDEGLGDIVSASGGTLACRKGPNPSKALAHPAVLDWALTEYLIDKSITPVGDTGYNALAMPFDMEFGKKILLHAREEMGDDIKALTMFQNIVSSSDGSVRYIYATKDENPDEPILLQKYNRCFIVKEGTENAVHLQAAFAKTITPAMIAKRKKENYRLQMHEPTALRVLMANGVKKHDIPTTKEAVTMKITGIEPAWHMLIDNSDLHYMPQEKIDKLFDAIDYDAYASLLADTYENNWMNNIPGVSTKEVKKEDAEE